MYILLFLPPLMISRTPCGLAAGMNGKSKDWKIWFRPFGRNKIGETPCALGTGIVNFKDFLYVLKYFQLKEGIRNQE